MSEIIKNIPFLLDIEKLKKNFVINNNREDEKELRGMVKEVEQLASPCAIYKEVYIKEKGKDYVIIEDFQFKSKFLRTNLEGVERAFVYIITVGKEVEVWADRKPGILKSFWAEEIQKMILNSTVDFIYNKLDGLMDSVLSSEFNPGSLNDWPIEEQVKIFLLLGDVENQIGVRLTENFLMLPAKSISGIKYPTKSGFKECQICERHNCPTRRADYKREVVEELNKIFKDGGDLY